MTTKVVISCPENSHWDVKVEVRDRVYDHEAQKMTDDWSLADQFVLERGASREVYVHSTRKLVIEEVETTARAGSTADTRR